MSDTSDQVTEPRGLVLELIYVLSVSMVLIGLINSTPGIPGYDALVADLTGDGVLRLRKFPFEWFYPAFVALMMLIVALQHSMWRDWKNKSPARRKLGLLLDIALVVTAFTISLTYLIEIESVCLIDRITGERARLIEESLASAAAFAESLGLSAPTTVEDPQCVATTGGVARFDRGPRDRRFPVLQRQGLGPAAGAGGDPDLCLHHHHLSGVVCVWH